MASAAQIEANQKNAKRSTGPKSAKGKSRARGNALKHGLRALTLIPGLTHEDPQQLRDKTLQLIDELQPGNQAELDQVCQAARLTLAIERADRFEMAHMNQRIRDAEHERAQEVNPRLLEEIQELGRRLLYISAAEEVKFPRQPLWADDPRLLVAKLEASAEGCRWLLARWAEFRILLDRGYRWNVGELLRFIRLQGKNVAEAVYDPMLNVLFVAWDVLVPKFAAEEWENFREERFREDPSFNHRQRWREIVARPGNADEAREVLYTLIEDQVENLNELLTRNEAREAVADPDWADRAALDLSPGFERLRRYQSAKIRELQRTLDTLCKLRMAELGSGNEQGGVVDGECQMADAQCQMADEPCDIKSGDNELKNPQTASNEANLVSTQSTDAQRIESEKADPEGRERSQFSRTETSNQPGLPDYHLARKRGPRQEAGEAEGGEPASSAGCFPLRDPDDLDSERDGRSESGTSEATLSGLAQGNENDVSEEDDLHWAARFIAMNPTLRGDIDPALLAKIDAMTSEPDS